MLELEIEESAVRAAVVLSELVGFNCAYVDGIDSVLPNVREPTDRDMAALLTLLGAERLIDLPYPLQANIHSAFKRGYVEYVEEHTGPVMPIVG